MRGNRDIYLSKLNTRVKAPSKELYSRLATNLATAKSHPSPIQVQVQVQQLQMALNLVSIMFLNYFKKQK